MSSPVQCMRCGNAFVAPQGAIQVFCPVCGTPIQVAPSSQRNGHSGGLPNPPAPVVPTAPVGATMPRRTTRFNLEDKAPASRSLHETSAHLQREGFQRDGLQQNMAETFRETAGQWAQSQKKGYNVPANLISPVKLGARQSRLASHILRTSAGDDEVTLQLTVRILEAAAQSANTPSEIALAQLSRAEVLAKLNKLTERDVDQIQAQNLSQRGRQTLANLYRSLASSAKNTGNESAMRSAALNYLKLAGATLPVRSFDVPTRIAVLLASGETADASTEALEQWLASPYDPNALQVAASAALKWALDAEERIDPIVARKRAWERSIALWGVLSGYETFWSQFSQVRSQVYGKEILSDDIQSAREATKQRIPKLIADAETQHRDAGRIQDAEEMSRLREVFKTELTVGEKLFLFVKNVIDYQHRSSSILQTPLAHIPMGPLALDCLDLRGPVQSELQRLSSLEPDNEELRDLVGLVGEMSEGWALVAAQRYRDAGLLALTKLRMAPRHQDAQRLLVSSTRYVLRELLQAPDIEGALSLLKEWFGETQPLPVEIADEIEGILVAMTREEQLDRSLAYVRSIRQRGDAPAWQRLEARAVMNMAVTQANNDNFEQALPQLLSAWDLCPDDTDVKSRLYENIDAIGRAFVATIKEREGYLAAFDRLEAMSPSKYPPLANARALTYLYRGVDRANNKNYPAALTDLRYARTIAENEGISGNIREVLGDVCLAQAAALMTFARSNPHYYLPQIRELLSESASMGNQEAASALVQLSPSPYSGYGGYPRY